MDFVDLFARPTLVGAPLSVLIRPGSTPEPDAEVINRVACLLADRPTGDEILIPVSTFPAGSPVLRIGGVRVRWIVIDPSIPGQGWSQLLAAARRPIIVLIDPRFLPERLEMNTMIERLQNADIVVGRRRRPGMLSWLAWPIDRTLRGLFGVPFADPFCPTRVLRRSAVGGVELQANGRMVDFELLAKTTYLTRLVDEVPITSAGTSENVTTMLVRSWSDLGSLVFSPRFGSPQRFEELCKESTVSEPSVTIASKVFFVNKKHQGSRWPRRSLGSPSRHPLMKSQRHRQGL